MKNCLINENCLPGLNDGVGWEIEKWAEIQEEKRIAILTSERIEILKQYEVDASLISVGQMTDDIWTKYLSGTKLEFEARKAKEAKEIYDRIEAEKKEAERIEAQRVENEILRKKTEEQELILKAEREKAQVEKAKAEAEAKKAKDISDKAIAESKAKADKLTAELKAKAEAEAKIEADRIKAEKLAKAAPDKIKLETVAKSIDLILSMSIVDFKTKEATKILEDAYGLLKKVSTFIREKSSNL